MNKTQRAMPASEMCDLLPPGSHVAILGDSLSGELVASWKARMASAFGPKPKLPDQLNDGRCASFEKKYDKECCTAEMEYSCPNGATVCHYQFVTMRPDKAMLEEFEAGDASCDSCLALSFDNPEAFRIKPWSAQHISQTLSQNNTVVIVNSFAHISFFIHSLSKCYARALGSDDSSAVRALAKRGALRLWRFLVASLSASLWDQVPHARSFYLTSPAPADQWVSTSSNGRVEGVRPRRPVELAAIAIDARNSGYMHDLYSTVNDMSAAAFSALGHGIIDVEWMGTMRIDDHQGSATGKGDFLHHCQPGTADFTLDVILREVSKQLSKRTR